MADKPGLATHYESDAATIRSLYDDWAGQYDADLAEWGYVAPVRAVELLAERCGPTAQVLDVGCGTGLVGAALSDAGFVDVVGVDISSDSLDIAAKTGVYRALAEVDLTELPTSLPDELFGALICVGVMSYLPDVEAVCREFARVVESDGIIVLTQRTDLFASRATGEAYAALVEDGTWEELVISDPAPYLPGHDEYAEIDVIYGVFRRL